MDAKVGIEQWRQHYNEVRPHSSLGYLTPAEFTAQLRAGSDDGGRAPAMPARADQRDSGVAFCNPESAAAFNDSDGSNVETRANEYAADLLLPWFMFKSASNGRPMTIDSVVNLATLFETSVTATAIRLVRYGSFPAVLIWTENGQVKWFRRGEDVPDSLWPREPGRKTFAHDIAKKGVDSGRGPVYVDEWFTGAVERHSVHEDSRRMTQDAVLSILWWTDERPLEEIVARDEGRAYRRSDWRKDD